MRHGSDEDCDALADLVVMLEARKHAEFFRWRGEMRMSREQQDWQDWSYWFDGPYQLFLAEGRRERDLANLVDDAAARQPAARGEQDESDALHDRLSPGFHWPQPEAHGDPRILPKPLSSIWKHRGDIGLDRFEIP